MMVASANALTSAADAEHMAHIAAMPTAMLYRSEGTCECVANLIALPP